MSDSEGPGNKFRPSDGGKVRVEDTTFEQENIEQYLQKVKVWKKLRKLSKAEHGLLLWYSLPDNHDSGIKDKIMNELGLMSLRRMSVWTNLSVLWR